MIDWHRLFGLALTDLFTDTPFSVTLEMDLSIQQQFLDVVVVRRTDGVLTERLPDGLDDLVDHNLISYKSLHEPLDDWALKELTAHYVAYRKLTGTEQLIAERHFRLYGVATRYPSKLARQIGLAAQQPGVYLARRGTDEIRIIVLREIPEGEHNALWHLFSAVEERVAWAATHYRPHTTESSTIIHQLFDLYRLEGVHMPYTLDDYRRDVARQYLERLSPEERLHGLSPEARMDELSDEEILTYLAERARRRQGERSH